MNGESEHTIQNRVSLALTNIGTRIFRNHVGMGWQGNINRFSRTRQITVQPGDVLVRNARALKAGLCNGSSDLIGWTPVEITAEMVGRTLAVFTAIETKREEQGYLTPEQSQFLEQVVKAGGIGLEARNAEETAKSVLLWHDSQL